MRSARLQREIDELIERGWQIEDEETDRVVMVDRDFGSPASHVVVAVLTIWWSMGVGNVLWGAYNYFANSRRRVLWESDAHAGCPNCGWDVPADASYCPNCGTDVADLGDTPHTEPDATACPECGAVVTEGSRYCSACGTNVADELASA